MIATDIPVSGCPAVASAIVIYHGFGDPVIRKQTGGIIDCHHAVRGADRFLGTVGDGFPFIYFFSICPPVFQGFFQ